MAMRLAAPLFAALVLAAGAHAAADDHASAIFASQAPLALRLRAPFDDLFARSAHDHNAAVTGSLAYTAPDGRDIRIDGVGISVRGNTSRQSTECTFPKLTLRIPSGPQRAASIFDGVDSVKLGTHCGDAVGERLTPKFGRLANEKAPLREAFVYRLLAIVGIPALQARPARITYDEAGGGQPPLVRNGMLLEDTSEARKRLAVGDEIAMERFESADVQLTTDDTAALMFAEAMIGNFDWCLRFTDGDRYRCDRAKPLWNILAFKRSGARALPVMHDFDLAGMVTGSHLWFDRVLNARFSASGSRTEVEVVSQLQHTRSLFGRRDLDATRRRFMRHEDEAFGALDAADLDAGGRAIIGAYLTAFFSAIATDEAFYRPVVIEPATAYAAARGSAPACPQGITAPPGTPVGPPIDRRGDRVQVQLLDALWHWTGPRACAAIRRGAVWVDARAIGTRYPP